MTPPTSASATLSLHDALPISPRDPLRRKARRRPRPGVPPRRHLPLEQRHVLLPRRRDPRRRRDRKSTRLNSSHLVISYAVFCLTKKTHQPAAHYSATPARRRQ